MSKISLKSGQVRLFSDDRGEVAFPLDEKTAEILRAGDVREMHAASLHPGAVRGNHYHPDHDEYMMCAGEGMKAYIMDGNEKKEVLPEEGLMKVEKGVPHAIVNEGERTGFVICFYGPPADLPLGQVKSAVV